jgi:hypothetical protein
VKVENRAICCRVPAAAFDISSSLVPVTTKPGPTISNPSNVLPTFARPRSSAGMVTSRKYFSVVKA